MIKFINIEMLIKNEKKNIMQYFNPIISMNQMVIWIIIMNNCSFCKF